MPVSSVVVVVVLLVVLVVEVLVVLVLVVMVDAEVFDGVRRKKFPFSTAANQCQYSRF
jgi:hypothetical protein